MTTPGDRRDAPLTWTLAVGQLLAWGVFYYALPVFVAPISAELGWSRELVFGGLSGALLTSVFVAPLVGRQIDRGRGRAALIGGELVGALCLLLLAWVNSPWLFLLLCCGIGISQGACLYESAFSLLHRHLAERAPRAIIRITLVAGLAGTVFVPASQFLVEAFGWRLAATILAPVGLMPAALYLAFVPRDDVAPPAGAADSVLAPMNWTPATIALVAAFAASTATFSTVTIHFLPLLIDRGLSGLAAAQIFALIGPAQILSRLAIWLVSDRLSVLGHGIIVFLMQAASVVVLALAGSGAGLVAFALLFGVSSGLLTIVRGTAPAALCGRHAIGRLNGAIGAVGGLSRALMPALFAATLARLGAAAALGGLLAVSLAGAAAFAAARLLHPRRAAIE